VYACDQAQKNMQTNKLFRELKIPVPSQEDQEKVIQMIEDINKEESNFNKNIKSIKENIKIMYECVEYIVNQTINNNIIDNNIIENDYENNNETYQEDNYIEYQEIEIKGKIYILDNENVHIKIKDGIKGELYGTYKNEKFKKI